MSLDFLGDLRRSHTCGALRAADAGKSVVLMGWVHRRRDLGNLIFIDVRDRTGLTQVVFNKDASVALHEKAGTLRSEYVIAVSGEVKKRQEVTVNRNIETGEIEVVARELRILNDAKTPPVSPAESVLPNEEMRLKYRYLDLRRAEMQSNLELRHRVALAIRKDLSAQGFFEIETPFMTRSTPEGARDYLVPSRVHPGSFYALPQSPQLFKQILMISGFDKYFQIVRCFRDEDLRADRQPEFTQIDLEMSFPQQERVFEVVESFLRAAFREAGVELPAKFPRMTYDEAIRQYGSDKPDLRLPAMVDVRECFAAEDLEKLGVNAGLPLVAVRIPKVGELSRKERDDIKPLLSKEKFSNEKSGERADAKVFEDFKRLEKNFAAAAAKVREKTGAQADDLLVLVAGGSKPGEHKSEGGVKPEVKQHDHAVCTAAGALRIALAQKYAERHKLFAGARGSADSYRFLWVTDFPMFEWDEDGQRWAAAHHPFTSPHEKDMAKLESDPGAVRATAYDIVLNGTELGSGSIRIHRQDIQQKIFRALGMSKDEAEARFGFFLTALEYGTPPHGGIALGLDRMVMIMAGAESLREVIPFPKTARAVDLMVDAPTAIGIAQEEELELISAWPYLSPEEKTLSSFCDQLFAFVNQDVLVKRWPADANFQQASSLILVKAYNDAKGAHKLAKAGYGPQSAGSSRSLVEAYINCRYIELNPEKHSKAFIDSIGVETEHLARRLRQHPQPGELREALEKANKIEREHNWPRNIQTRAYAFENPSYTYDVVFLLLSQLLHSSIASLAGFLKPPAKDETAWNIGPVGPSHEWVEEALATIFIYFHQVVLITSKSWNLSTEKLDSVELKFREFTHTRATRQRGHQ